MKLRLATSSWTCVVAVGWVALGGCSDGGTFAEFVVPAGEPREIALGPDGNVWFTERGGLGRITPAGVVTEVPLPSGTPNSVVAGPDGKIWFSVTSDASLPGAIVPGNKIGRLDPGDLSVMEFPLPTVAGDPWALAAGPDGNVWFTDTVINKIGRITPDGVVTEFPAQDPLDITGGPDGNVWYSQLGAIAQITPDGQTSSFGATGGRFITSSRDGHLWFSEAGTYSIGRMSTSGDAVSFELPDNMQALGMAPAPDGNVWFAAAFSKDQGLAHRIGRITPTGAVTYFEIPTPGGAPMDVVVRPDGTVWFTEVIGYKIGRFQPP